ncbi:MAG TPA: DUF790 family protein, partial [Pirellulaceae bacterium]|nr:DUF790 family protein [Pirellulaceae bacterium]
MLTKDQMLARYDFLGGRLVPDRLTRKSHARYVEHAERMLQVYRHGVGLTRAELHREVTQILAADEDCPVRRVDAFCKLLDDVSEFERDRRGAAAELRRQVFRTAARSHPLVRQADRLFEHAEEEVKQRIAHELGRPWAEIDRDLFADIMEFHRLERFDGYPDGPALLARYNVAQVQVALYGATAMNVWATGDFKTILRYAKLAKLMHSITRSGENEYLMRFDGPASVLRETRRYGVNMAKFLPALIACRGWRMSATVPVGKH